MRARVDGPPEPMMMPVISWEISLSSSPASRIACSMATWFQAAPPPRNRMARRSTVSVASSVGAPCTWQRKPSSAYLSARAMPDFAARRLASTSWVLFPIDETMPIPVTTTRLIEASSASQGAFRQVEAGMRSLSFGSPRTRRPRGPPSAPARLHHRVLAEQADLQVHRPVDDRAVRRKPSLGDPQHELGTHDPLDVDPVDHVLDRGNHLPGELELAQSERAALAGGAQPAQEEAEQLPQRIQAEAAGHDRITLEMTGEKPEIRLEIEH